MSEQVITTEAATETASVHAALTLVADAEQKLLDANASRHSFTVSADTADVWLYYGASAAVYRRGIAVRAGGIPFVERSWKGEVHIISHGAAIVGCTELELATGDDEGERPTGADTFTPSGPGDAAIPDPSLSQQVPPPPTDPSL